MKGFLEGWLRFCLWSPCGGGDLGSLETLVLILLACGPLSGTVLIGGRNVANPVGTGKGSGDT